MGSTWRTHSRRGESNRRSGRENTLTEPWSRTSSPLVCAQYWDVKGYISTLAPQVVLDVEYPDQESREWKKWIPSFFEGPVSLVCSSWGNCFKPTRFVVTPFVYTKKTAISPSLHLWRIAKTAKCFVGQGRYRERGTGRRNPRPPLKLSLSGHQKGRTFRVFISNNDK